MLIEAEKDKEMEKGEGIWEVQEEGRRNPKRRKKKSLVVKKITAYEKLYQKVKNLIESLEK